MARSHTPYEDLIEGLRQDILWLLSVIFALRVRAAFPTIATMSREDFMVETILLESANRDIIARVTALDDDHNRSFRTALAAMNRQGLNPSRRQRLDHLVKEFRKVVNDLKVKHRNAYVAHVQDLAEVGPRVLDAPVKFEEAASQAVRLLDEFVGREVNYILRPGSRELPVDLRARLSS